MLKLSKKTEYAVIAILDMANGRTAGLTTAKTLSQRYNIPRELMGKVLQGLARQGVIVSQQGVKGGYQLTFPLKDINLNKVISAVEGPINLVDCNAAHDGGCDQLDNCNIKSPMEFIQVELTRFFDGITLQDFKDKANWMSPLIQIQG